MFKSLPAFIIALIFFAVGIMMLVKRLKQLKHNTATTQATIIDYVKETHYDAETGDSTVYFPILRYNVDGVEYERKDSYGVNGRLSEIGKEVTINYNPEKPDEFNIADQKSAWIIPIGVSLAGLILAIYMIEW